MIANRQLCEPGRADRNNPGTLPYHDPMDAAVYRTARGRVSDDELREAFAYVLRPEVPDDKFHLALQLFVEMEK